MTPIRTAWYNPRRSFILEGRNRDKGNRDMITRIKLPDGSTHLRNPSDVRRTLCGLSTSEADPFGETLAPETNESVSCPHCAKTYCAVKDEPWG